MELIKILHNAIKPNPLGIDYNELVDRNLNVLPQEFINEVLCWCQNLRIYDLTQLKLQKLLYYSYAICLWNIKATPFLPVILNKQCQGKDFMHDKMQKKYDNKYIDFWKLGPVMPLAYEAFKNYGNVALSENFGDFTKLFLKKDIDPQENDDLSGELFMLKESDIKIGIQASIKYALIALSDLPTTTLIDMTHSKQSAWHFFFEVDSAQSNNNEFVLQKIVEEIQSFNFFQKEYNDKKERYVK